MSGPVRRTFALPSLLAALALLVCALPAAAATYPSGFAEQIVAEGLSRPMAVAWAPGGRVFAIEKDGVLVELDADTRQATLLLDITGRVNSYLDRGLLGLAVDPQFQTTGYVYLLYTHDRPELMMRDSDAKAVAQLRRVKLTGTTVSEQTVILGSDTSVSAASSCPSPSNTLDCIPSDSGSHSIGTIRTDPDGSLWVGVGDGASSGGVDELAFRTYDEHILAGKILHIDKDGRGLPGHPFCPAETNLSHVCTKLHSKGFRNPFRFALRPGGGLTVGDVGWNEREEIDVISSAGGNYGWPCYEGDHRTPAYEAHDSCVSEYAKEGTAQADRGPTLSYPHPRGGDDPPITGLAALGGPTYLGDAYPAGYRDSTFVGDYGAGFVKRLVPNGSNPPTVVDFAGGWSGVDLLSTPAGDLAYVDPGDFSDGAGTVREVVYGPNGRPTARPRASPSFGPAPLTVRFEGAGSSDPDGDPLSYAWEFGDGATSTGADSSHEYSADGTYTARLTVSDGRGGSDSRTTKISVGNSPPEFALDVPAGWRGGQPLSLHATGSDAEDGALPASALNWSVVLVHGRHLHPIGTFTGSDLSFAPNRDHDADSYFRVRLSAQDSQELEGVETVEVHPVTSPLRLDSEPSGAGLTYSGLQIATPFAKAAAVGFAPTVAAPLQFQRAGRSYEFSRWSDEGARLHSIVVPDSGLSLTALYRDVTPTAPARDGSGPRLSLLRLDPRQGLVKGRASDPSGVRSLQVAVGRAVRGRRCLWWLPSKHRLSRDRRSCSKPAWINAKLSGSTTAPRWQALLRRHHVPAGGYRLVFRGIDGAGNETRALTNGARVVKVTVRAKKAGRR